MASIFISYSRRDIESARKLTEAFKGQDLDFWIDWEGIAPTVDWWKEIEKGIEEADIFLFLISPDSAKSRVCRQEIEHAARNGKRLIPLVVRDIKADESPSELSSLNWIFFRENDDFNLAFGNLITAIKTDYEWVQAHRQLQVKALEWDRNNRENSFLLRGKELQDAELQLARNSSKEPYPTDLQREYVLKSRQATDTARRRLIAGLIGFSAIVLSLLVFALLQLQISRAQQLGTQAQALFLGGDYNYAGLYAFQSNKTYENEAANFVLSRLPYENFWLGKTLQGHTDSVFSVAWSRDGKLASASGDRTVIVWDLATGKPALRLTGHTDSVSSVAWSTDGQLASGSQDDTVILWDLTTGKPARTLRGHSSAVDTIVWSADGRLASGSWDSTVIIWDLTTGKPAQTLTGHTGTVYSVAWSADGQLASGSGAVTVQLTSALEDNMVIIWDLATGKPAQILTGHTSEVISVAWSADGRLASASVDGTVRVPRRDLTGVSPCTWSIRNMSESEWIGSQGLLYPYEATCPNLPRPAVAWWLTWKGRFIYLGFVLLNIGVLWSLSRRVKGAWKTRRVLLWIPISILANILFLKYLANQ